MRVRARVRVRVRVRARSRARVGIRVRVRVGVGHRAYEGHYGAVAAGAARQAGHHGRATRV